MKTKSSNRVSGQTLYENARGDVFLCNCKKAMSLIPKLVPKIVQLNNEDGSVVGYASGKTEEDFLKHINDGMYAMLNGKLPTDEEMPVALPANATEPTNQEADDDDVNMNTNNGNADNVNGEENSMLS